tara:strand:+ start:377 stop:1213 length:837 start_codon:yes stop_codon:yes gene_type:complete
MNRSKYILIGISSLLIACAEQSPEESTEKDSVQTESNEIATKIQWKYDMLLVNHINAPVKLLAGNDFDKKGFNEGLTNPLSNAEKYNSNNTKALGLGVYGSDLGYISTYDQTQEMLDYILKLKNISDDLSIPVFDAETIKQFEASKEDEKKTIDLIYKKYEEMDKYLVENERYEILTLITAGGYVEGLYISLDQIINNELSNEKEILMEQKAVLKNLMSILADFKDNTYISDVSKDLQGVSNAFETIDYDKTLDKSNLGKLQDGLVKLREKIISNAWG